MSSKYPLCESAGLNLQKVGSDYCSARPYYVLAADVEAYLASQEQETVIVVETKPAVEAPMVFKAEDFGLEDPDYGWLRVDRADIVRIANAKLKAWLASAPVVRCKMNGDSMDGFVQTWQNSTQTIYGASATHTARLVCIEPIVQAVDTAEGLLRELKAARGDSRGHYFAIAEALFERIDKLLKEADGEA